MRTSYLHGKMVNETKPAAGMLQENVNFLFESLPFALSEYVFRFEFLIDGKVNRIVRIRYANSSTAFSSLVIGVAARSRRVGKVSTQVMNVLIVTGIMRSFSFHRCRHSSMMRLPKSRQTTRGRTQCISLQLPRCIHSQRIL